MKWLYELILIGQKIILGSGQFGIVFKGILRIAGDTMDVAVKTVTPGVDIEIFKSLLSEIKIMEYLGTHENVIQMFGACTEQIEKCDSY